MSQMTIGKSYFPVLIEEVASQKTYVAIAPSDIPSVPFWVLECNVNLEEELVDG